MNIYECAFSRDIVTAIQCLSDEAVGYLVGKTVSGIFHVYVVVEHEREFLHELPLCTSVWYFINPKKYEN